MPKLTVVNITTHDVSIQDPSGWTGFSMHVGPMATVSDLVITEEAFEQIRAVLDALTTASKITWSIKQSEGDVLSVGDKSLGYTYASGKANWFDVDGANPPTVPAMRFIDQTTGVALNIWFQGGHLYVNGVQLV